MKMKQASKDVYGWSHFSVAGRFWCVPWNVTGVSCRCLIFLHKGPVPQFYVGQFEMMCMSPSVHDISLPCARMFYSHIAHCLLVWSQQRRPPQTHTHTHTHMHTHRSTVCHCITLHSLGHTVHIYSFITMRHFVWRKGPTLLDPWSPLRQPQALTAPCARVTACLYSASHQTVQPTQQHTQHREDSPNPEIVQKQYHPGAPVLAFYMFYTITHYNTVL